MGLQVSKSSRSKTQEQAVVPSVALDSQANAEVAYGKAFLLRCCEQQQPYSMLWRRVSIARKEGESLYCCANEATQTLEVGKVMPNSLFTFHSQHANPVNFSRQTTPWIMIQYNAIVTMYANVGTGQYLDHESFQFRTSPHQARNEDAAATRCEFIIRSCNKSNSSSAVRFGDEVCLECVTRPGFFLQRSNLGFQLSCANKRKCKFVLHNPTLSELVQLQANRMAESFAPQQQQQRDNEDFIRDEERALVAKEKQLWLALANALPIDLVRRILEYKRYFVQTQRLCCKSWMLSVEREHVRRIRVNGELFSLETPEQRRALLTFIARCQNVQRLTLRNIIALTDDDTKEICQNRNLIHLILGGCRSLSDRTTIEVCSKLPKLKSLNMANTEVTDISLEYMANMKSLEDINLYSCRGVTAEGVNKFVTENTSALLRMNLRGTITHADALQRFSLRNPQVEVLTGPASSESIYG